jgi:signal peptidase I
MVVGSFMAEQPDSGSKKRVFLEYLQAVILAILLALIIRHFIVEAYRIPTDAMIPTLRPGDTIFINKLSYFSKVPLTDEIMTKIHPPRRGDVVVFSSPLDQTVRYIKRVIGLPGDVIKIDGNQLWLNGKLASQRVVGDFSYLEPTTGHSISGKLLQTKLEDSSYRVFSSEELTAETNQRADIKELSVPPGQFFVLGDNLRASVDSRHFGFVPFKHLKGKAAIVALSWDGGKQRFRWSRFGNKFASLCVGYLSSLRGVEIWTGFLGTRRDFQHGAKRSRQCPPKSR